jgi:3-oxoadipate enol-lactonase/4-carboxymuconolactone decarboxylase
VQIAYHQTGSGPALVLIGGEHASMTTWDPELLSALASHYQITYFDLPGSGYSGGSARSLSAVADLTAGLIDGLGLAQPDVLGWGLGADVALALAERHPGILAKLVLLEPGPLGTGPLAPSAAVAAALARPDETLGALSRLYFPPAANAARQAWLARLAEVSPDDLSASGVRSEAALDASAAHDPALLNDTGAIRVPALVIDGAADEVVPPANATRLVARLRHGRHLVLPGAGYGAVVQDETRVVSAIESFTG